MKQMTNVREKSLSWKALMRNFWRNIFLKLLNIQMREFMNLEHGNMLILEYVIGFKHLARLYTQAMQKFLEWIGV